MLASHEGQLIEDDIYGGPGVEGERPQAPRSEQGLSRRGLRHPNPGRPVSRVSDCWRRVFHSAAPLCIAYRFLQV